MRCKQCGAVKASYHYSVDQWLCIKHSPIKLELSSQQAQELLNYYLKRIAELEKRLNELEND
jgi:hypothetical protein